MNNLPLEPANGGSLDASGEIFQAFPDVKSFSAAIKKTFGVDEDLAPVLALNTDFSQVTSQYLLMNIKEYNSPKPDNLIFLAEDNVFVCSQNIPTPVMFKEFEDVLDKSFGKSTIVAFLVINQVMDKLVQYLETLSKGIRKQEELFNHEEYRALSLEFERYSDRVEELNNLIIGLQERRYKQIQTQYIVFDYRVLIAEIQTLQTRCRRRLSYLKDLRQDHEMKTTEELNQKIIRMNDILKKLTSITVILMLPTLIASHFGMNLPELQVGWVYPSVIIGQLVIMGVFFFIFKKIGWL
jgi:Mg2+ and Co2+ transporter CorA